MGHEIFSLQVPAARHGKLAHVRGGTSGLVPADHLPSPAQHPLRPDGLRQERHRRRHVLRQGGRQDAG